MSERIKEIPQQRAEYLQERLAEDAKEFADLLAKHIQYLEHIDEMRAIEDELGGIHQEIVQTEQSDLSPSEKQKKMTQLLSQELDLSTRIATFKRREQDEDENAQKIQASLDVIALRQDITRKLIQDLQKSFENTPEK